MVLGEPIFNDDKIQRGLESLPKALDVMKAAVKILNNSYILEILGKFLLKIFQIGMIFAFQHFFEFCLAQSKKNIFS